MNRQEVYDMIRNYDIGMLTNINEDGNLVSHPMTRKGEIEDNAIWLFSEKNSEKVKELEKNNQANITFSGKDYISVSGKVEVIEDANKKKNYGPKI